MNYTGPQKYTCFKLNTVTRKIQRYYETALAPYGITPVQFFIFSIIYEGEGIKFKDLASKANLDGSTLTGILDRMENAGLVEKKDDPEDRRGLLIFLTSKSKELAPNILENADLLELKLNQLFDAQEFATFSKILSQLYATELENEK